MAKPLGFEKPLGMRDILPPVLERKRMLERHLFSCIHRWGYREIQTPTLEYNDTVGGASPTLDDKLFKLLDRQGKTLVLRPDMTGPIARVTASLLRNQPLPLRLMYHSNVFRAQENEAGRNAEFEQTGVELIGIPSIDADAEVIALAVASLRAAGVEKFKIAVGHVGYLDGLLREMVPEAEDRKQLKDHLLQHNYVGFRHRVDGLNIDDSDRDRLRRLLELRGGADRLDEAAALTRNGKARAAVDGLRELWETLQSYGVTDDLLFDLNLVMNLDYYTGILFEGYAADLGFPICSGGRYDDLLTRFGRPAPATGFMIKMDRLLEASTLQYEKQEQRLLILYSKSARHQAIREAEELRRTERHIVSTLLVDDPAAHHPVEDGFDRVIRMGGESGV